MDFWELNKYVACHTRDVINVCEEVMREWRRMEQATKIVDLVGLPSNSRGQETMTVSIGWV